MAFQAGMLNIGGFMACHRFVSHITGFAAFFGRELSQPDNSHALGMLAVPLFFLFGCMISGQLVDIRLKLHKKPKYYLTFGLIFFLLCLVFIFGQLGRFGEFGQDLELSRNYTLLILLCLTCGIQNGTITTVSKSVIRTTHLTGITTDLGLGLVRYFNRSKLKIDTMAEVQANLMRTGIIVFFILGSMLGGYLFTKVEYLGFLVPAVTSGILFGLMFYYQVYQKRTVSSHS